MEKDEGPEAEALPRLLIVVEGPYQICSIFINKCNGAKDKVEECMG